MWRLAGLRYFELTCTLCSLSAGVVFFTGCCLQEFEKRRAKVGATSLVVPPLASAGMGARSAEAKDIEEVGPSAPPPPAQV